ncbi:30S ribosomal protein S13 [Candidatus Woesearchaeota archaeon]|nr:30S ribosomal protein S13 [Candidatus Woesearchaeota archaeon]
MAEPQKPTSSTSLRSEVASVTRQQLPENYKHIVRVANVDIPGEKQVVWALTKIKGIGINFASAVCAVSNISRDKKAGNLNDEEVKKLNAVMQDPSKHGIPIWMFNRKKDYDTGENKHLVTGTLSFVQENDLKRLKKIRTLRGVRHSKGLTVRGQRTKSNFRRNKGKVVGVVKTKVAPEKAADGDKKGGAKAGAKKEKKS